MLCADENLHHYLIACFGPLLYMFKFVECLFKGNKVFERLDLWSQALYFQFGIKLNNVVDTQVSFLVTRLQLSLFFLSQSYNVPLSWQNELFSLPKQHIFLTNGLNTIFLEQQLILECNIVYQLMDVVKIIINIMFF